MSTHAAVIAEANDVLTEMEPAAGRRGSLRRASFEDVTQFVPAASDGEESGESSSSSGEESSGSEFEEDNPYGDISVAALVSESQTPFAKVTLMLRSLRPHLPGFAEEAAGRSDSMSSSAGGSRLGRRDSMHHHFVHPTLKSSPLERLDWCLEHLEEYAGNKLVNNAHAMDPVQRMLKHKLSRMSSASNSNTDVFRWLQNTYTEDTSTVRLMKTLRPDSAPKGDRSPVPEGQRSRMFSTLSRSSKLDTIGSLDSEESIESLGMPHEGDLTADGGGSGLLPATQGLGAHGRFSFRRRRWLSVVKPEAGEAPASPLAAASQPVLRQSEAGGDRAGVDAPEGQDGASDVPLPESSAGSPTHPSNDPWVETDGVFADEAKPIGGVSVPPAPPSAVEDRPREDSGEELNRSAGSVPESAASRTGSRQTSPTASRRSTDPHMQRMTVDTSRMSLDATDTASKRRRSLVPDSTMSEDPLREPTIRRQSRVESDQRSKLSSANLLFHTSDARLPRVTTAAAIQSSDHFEFSPSTNELLSQWMAWDFDIFRLDKLSAGRPLVALGMRVFQEFDLFFRLHLDPVALGHCLSAFEDGYASFPTRTYHNNVHAADVTQASAAMLLSGCLEGMFSDLEVFSCLLAAAAHDIGHPGFTNQFLVATHHPLAILYNDQSVLENHHAATAFKILQREECNVLAALPPADQVAVRAMMIEVIITTDMSKHFQFLAQMKSFTERVEAGAVTVNPDVSPEDRLMILQGIVHCADLSASTRPLDTSAVWARRIIDEFFHQGDRERALGLEIGPLNDRHKTSFPGSQIGFIDFIVKPLFETWSVIGGSDPYLRYLKENRSHWQRLKEEQEPKEDALDKDTPADGSGTMRSPRVRRRKHKHGKIQRRRSEPMAAPAALTKDGGENVILSRAATIGHGWKRNKGRLGAGLDLALDGEAPAPLSGDNLPPQWSVDMEEEEEEIIPVGQRIVSQSQSPADSSKGGLAAFATSDKRRSGLDQFTSPSPAASPSKPTAKSSPPTPPRISFV